MFRASALALVLTTSSAIADPLATSSACGHALSLSRDSAGEVTINIARASTPLGRASGAATLQTYAITGGSALIALVREGDLVALGAVVHCNPHTHPSLTWHGDLRWRGEDLGQRVRDDVVSLDTDRDGQPEVVVGTRYESVDLCGTTHPIIDARRLDGATGRLVPTTLDPLIELGPQSPTTAPRLVTTVPTELQPLLPLRRLSVLSQGVAQSPRALVDGDPSTSQSLPRRSVITFGLDRGPALLRAIDLTVPALPASLPRRWTVLTFPGALRFDVEVPDAHGRTPGQRLQIPLVGASRANCVLLATTDTDGALAELRPETSLDDSPDPLAALVALSDGPSGEDAARLLAGLGARGMRALADALPAMSAIGARRAVRLLDNLRGLPEPDQRAVSSAVVAALSRTELSPSAAETLRRHGAVALGPLTEVVATEPGASATISLLPVASELRARALAAALDAEGEPWSAARAALRNVLPALSREGRAGPWIQNLPVGARAQSRGLRAAAESLGPGDVERATVAARATALWTQHHDFEVRYRLLGPLVGDAQGRAVVRDALAHDPDGDLRAEAARVLSGTHGANDALRAALSDVVPRVRAAAATGLARVPATRTDLGRVLASDPWPSVRVAAVNALAGDGAASAMLTSALAQTSFAVVRSALVALGSTPGENVGAALVAFADNDRHNPELRVIALESLGARCDPASSPHLERIASSLSDPALPPNVQAVGHAALASLASIDPERARRWLAQAEANAQATGAVNRAMRHRCVRPNSGSGKMAVYRQSIEGVGPLDVSLSLDLGRFSAQ